MPRNGAPSRRTRCSSASTMPATPRSAAAHAPNAPTPGSTMRSASRDDVGIGGDRDVSRARAFSALCDRMEIARAVIDQRDRRLTSMPLVRGIASALRGSISTASRSARARPLNAALGDVMVVRPVQRLDVQRDPGGLREASGRNARTSRCPSRRAASARIRSSRRGTAAPKCRARRASASRPSARARRRSAGCRACRPAPCATASPIASPVSSTV